MVDLKCHSPLKTTTKLKAQFLTLTMRTCWTERWLIEIFGWRWISFFPLALIHLSWCQKLRFVTICYHSSRKEEKRISTSVIIYKMAYLITGTRTKTETASMVIFILPIPYFNLLNCLVLLIVVCYHPREIDRYARVKLHKI